MPVNNRRVITHRATGIGKTVATLAIIGAVAAGCSSGGAGEASTDGAKSTSANAPEDATPPPVSPEDRAEITAITKTYVTGLNNGDAKMLEHAMCQATLDQFGDLSVGARPSADPQQVTGITDISVNGDIGFATVEYTLVSDPSAPSKTAPLGYKNEDGWKVCTEP